MPWSSFTYYFDLKLLISRRSHCTTCVMPLVTFLTNTVTNNISAIQFGRKFVNFYLVFYNAYCNTVIQQRVTSMFEKPTAEQSSRTGTLLIDWHFCFELTQESYLPTWEAPPQWWSSLRSAGVWLYPGPGQSGHLSDETHGYLWVITDNSSSFTAHIHITEPTQKQTDQKNVYSLWPWVRHYDKTFIMHYFEVWSIFV